MLEQEIDQRPKQWRPAVVLFTDLGDIQAPFTLGAQFCALRSALQNTFFFALTLCSDSTRDHV